MGQGYKRKFQLNLLINIIILKFTIERCPSHRCDSTLNPNTCASIFPNFDYNINQFDYFSVSVNLCGGTQYCNISSMDKWSKTQMTNFTCAEKNYYPLVDQEPCINNTECATNKCINGICNGIAENKTCSSTIECQSGLYCDSKNKICSKQKIINSLCSIDEECVNWGGCYNSTCLEYWTLPEGRFIPSPALAELYCESGYFLNGKCAHIIIQEPMPYSCNITHNCKYKIRENNQLVEIPELCTCGYNTDGNSFCHQGSDSNIFYKYKELSKSNLDQGCHVLKKFTCANQINFMDIINRQNYYNAWKGLYQLTDGCLVSFYSNSIYMSFSLFSLLMIYLFII